MFAYSCRVAVSVYLLWCKCDFIIQPKHAVAVAIAVDDGKHVCIETIMSFLTKRFFTATKKKKKKSPVNVSTSVWSRLQLD